MDNNILPLRDKVLVKKDNPEEISKGGIILPETTLAKDTQQLGTVVDVGLGITNADGVFTPNELKPGQRIIYNKYCGTDCKELGDGLWLISESEILARLE